MDNHKKLLGFAITSKGAVITHTTNQEEAGENTFKSHKINVERVPSDKLKMALRVLLGHALLKCGFTEGKILEKEINSRKVVDMPAFKAYNVESFSIKGDGDDEKLAMSISKTLKSGEVININVPPILIADENYPFHSQIAQDIDTAIKECWDYEAGKNYFIQGDLFKTPATVGNEEDNDEI